MTSKICKICLYCGQPLRPELFLKEFEKRELERLVELGDWRAWAKRVLELSNPMTQKAREIFHKATSGEITPEGLKKMNKELAELQKERFVP